MDKDKKLEHVIDEAVDAEDKIKVALDFMRTSLSQEGSPRLRDFWEAKALCLPLFKQRIAPAARAYFWEEFVQLSDEARRLKEVLDEQSAFAAEAIDRAIEAVEKEFAEFDSQLKSVNACPFPKGADAVMGRKAFYDANYREVYLLTNFSSRLNALKQEVSKTSMRVRQKGRIFQKLQELREQILPRRALIVEEVSKAFIEDVTNFVQLHEKTPTKPFYALREEIRALQDLSKTFSISTEAFGQVRELLSGLWDQIRVMDKERKKNQNEKKQLHQQNLEKALEQIELLAKRIADEKLNAEKAKPLFSEMYTTLRGIDLHRDGVKKCKDRLSEMQDSFEVAPTSSKAMQADRMDAKAEQKQQLEQEQQALVDAALQELESSDPKTIQAKIEALDVQEALLDPLHDLLIEKTQESLLENEEVLVSDVEKLMDMRKSQRERLKLRIESIRKASGSSNVDFEKSMELDAQLKEHKQQLEAIGVAIKALSDLIADA